MPATVILPRSPQIPFGLPAAVSCGRRHWLRARSLARPVLPPASPWIESAGVVKRLAEAFQASADPKRRPDAPLRPRYQGALAELARDSLGSVLVGLIAAMEERLPDGKKYCMRYKNLDGLQ